MDSNPRPQVLLHDAIAAKPLLHNFQPHSRPINCLSFSPFDSNKLVSTSYDGSVRCFDLDDQAFSLIYGNDDDGGDVYTGSHCHVDAHTYLVSFGRTGVVGMVNTYH